MMSRRMPSIVLHILGYIELGNRGFVRSTVQIVDRYMRGV